LAAQKSSQFRRGVLGHLAAEPEQRRGEEVAGGHDDGGDAQDRPQEAALSPLGLHAGWIGRAADRR
jgi:hypothetical protein